jgi:hypothetical protein
MEISVKAKLIVEKENDYLELDGGDQINVTFKDGSVLVATIEKFSHSELVVIDDESDAEEFITIPFDDIEDIEEG